MCLAAGGGARFLSVLGSGSYVLGVGERQRCWWKSACVRMAAVCVNPSGWAALPARHPPAAVAFLIAFAAAACLLGLGECFA